MYPTLDPKPFPAPPSHFLPSAASSPSHLPAGHGEKFRRTERTFSSALVSAEWRAQRENDRREERGSEAEKEAGLLVQQLRSVIQEIANALLKNRSLNFADVERIYGPNNYKPAPDRFID